MKHTDIYLIHWYGPFATREELKKWEEASTHKFNLYIFQAKQNNKKNKYYCGMTFRQTVAKRMSNHDHHIHDFEDNKSSLQIWVGRICNKRPSKSDISVCENLITSELANISVGEKDLENRINKNPPFDDVYIIHEWWKKDETELYKRTKDSIPAIMPDVMMYYSQNKALYGADKLKFIGDL